MTAEKNHDQEGKLATYSQVVNYLLETYATDDVIVKAKTKVTSFKQFAVITAMQCSEAL